MKEKFFTILFIIIASVKLFSQTPQPLGHGVRTSGQIYCFAYDSINNRLYAGGIFENIGGIETPNIGYFDGVQWHAMNAGLPGVVTCMKMLNGNLYVGGSFSQSGNVNLHNIAMWDGVNWSAVGTTVVTNYTVMGLEVYKNQLYLSAFLAMGIGSTGMVKWDGANWNLIANTNSTNASILLYSANDTLFLHGGFQTINGNTISNLAAYDSVNFYDYSISTPVSSMAYNNNKLYAAGNSGYYYHYANNAWIQDAQNGLGGDALLFTYNDSLYATFANGGTLDTLEIWNYTNATKINKCGSTFYPIQYQVKIDAAIEANQKVYVGGLFYNLGGKQIATSASYDGLVWNQFGGAAITYYDAWLNASISTLVRDTVTGDIYAGGSFLFAGDSIAFNVARWDGTNWQPMGEGFSSAVNKLIFYNGSLYACGRFKRSGSTVVNAIAKWNGTAWVAVGTGSSGSLYDMKVFNNELYVAGNFTTFNGLSANYMVKYNGTSWSVVGSNDLDDIVLRLCVYNNKIIASARIMFFNLSTNLAELNNSVWSGMTYVPGSFTTDLMEYNGSLYAASDDDVYKLSANTWLPTGLTGLWGNSGAFNLINNQLVTTISNDGMYVLDTTWKPFQYFIQAYGAVQLNSTDYVIGGFFPYYFDGLKDVYLYNVALLQLKKPSVAYTVNTDSICSHQYIFFNAPSSTFPVTYEWQFPGGIPATSNLQSPIVKYNTPGNYDVFFKATNYYGVDSIFTPLQIQVYSCTVGLDEQVASADFLIYPNPANEEVHIFSESKMESVMVMDGMGKCVYNRAANNSNQVDLNLTDYPKGIYLVCVKGNDKFFTQKFIRN